MAYLGSNVHQLIEAPAYRQVHVLLVSQNSLQIEEKIPLKHNFLPIRSLGFEPNPNPRKQEAFLCHQPRKCRKISHETTQLLTEQRLVCKSCEIILFESMRFLENHHVKCRENVTADTYVLHRCTAN